MRNTLSDMYLSSFTDTICDVESNIENEIKDLLSGVFEKYKIEEPEKIEKLTTAIINIFEFYNDDIIMDAMHIDMKIGMDFQEFIQKHRER